MILKIALILNGLFWAYSVAMNLYHPTDEVLALSSMIFLAAAPTSFWGVLFAKGAVSEKTPLKFKISIGALAALILFMPIIIVFQNEPTPVRLLSASLMYGHLMVSNITRKDDNALPNSIVTAFLSLPCLILAGSIAQFYPLDPAWKAEAWRMLAQGKGTYQGKNDNIVFFLGSGFYVLWIYFRDLKFQVKR